MRADGYNPREHQSEKYRNRYERDSKASAEQVIQFVNPKARLVCPTSERVIAGLPKELWKQITSHVIRTKNHSITQGVRNITNFARTCRDFDALARETSIEWINSKNIRLKKLGCTEWQGNEERAVQLAVQYKFESVNLHGFESLGDGHIIALKTLHPGIRRLVLWGPWVTDIALKALSTSNLERLELRGCSEITKAGLRCLPKETKVVIKEDAEANKVRSYIPRGNSFM